MILTGKAKEDFLIKIYYQEDTNQASDEAKKELLFHHAIKWIERQDERFINALIIEWFDSIGFYIKIYPHLRGSKNVFYASFIYRDEKYKENERNVLFGNGELYYSINRQEATTEAIKKANEIYNNKK